MLQNIPVNGLKSNSLTLYLLLKEDLGVLLVNCNWELLGDKEINVERDKELESQYSPWQTYSFTKDFLLSEMMCSSERRTEIETDGSPGGWSGSGSPPQLDPIGFD